MNRPPIRNRPIKCLKLYDSSKLLFYHNLIDEQEGLGPCTAVPFRETINSCNLYLEIWSLNFFARINMESLYTIAGIRTLSAEFSSAKFLEVFAIL